MALIEKEILITLDNLKQFKELLSDKYKAELALKQDKGSLKAGDHVSLVSNNDGTITISVNDMPSATPPFKFEIVQSLASIDTPNIYTIYLVRKNTGSTGNLYLEYLYTNDLLQGDARFELIGDTQVSLDGYLTSANASATYVTKTELANAGYLTSNTAASTYATNEYVAEMVSEIPSLEGYLRSNEAAAIYATKAELENIAPSGGEVTETTKWQIPDGKDWNSKYFARIANWDDVKSTFEVQEGTIVLDIREVPLVEAYNEETFTQTELGADLEYEEYTTAFNNASKNKKFFAIDNSTSQGTFADIFGTKLFETSFYSVNLSIADGNGGYTELVSTNQVFSKTEKFVKVTEFDSGLTYYNKEILEEEEIENYVKVDDAEPVTAENFDAEDRYTTITIYTDSITTSKGKFEVSFIKDALSDGLSNTASIFRKGVNSIVISVPTSVTTVKNANALFISVVVDYIGGTSCVITRRYYSEEYDIDRTDLATYESIIDTKLETRVDTEEIWYSLVPLTDGISLYETLEDTDSDSEKESKLMRKVRINMDISNDTTMKKLIEDIVALTNEEKEEATINKEVDFVRVIKADESEAYLLRAQYTKNEDGIITHYIKDTVKGKAIYFSQYCPPEYDEDDGSLIYEETSSHGWVSNTYVDLSSNILYYPTLGPVTYQQDLNVDNIWNGVLLNVLSKQEEINE